MTNKTKIRQPIVTVCGHVDHGKTSLLDSLRESAVTQGEAGGITQKISFTSYPLEQLKRTCPLIEKSGIKLNIPGFLFIDTPGHAAFTNLRKRGGSLADLAILVIDINEGIKPQTAEVIQILKINKTPFIIALNKIDRISGWTSHESGGAGLKESIESQPLNAKQEFEEKFYTLIGSLNNHGFDSDLYFNISDFTKKIALVPCSAKTKQGIPELLMMLCGLSEKYLADRLKLGKDAKGVILEIKKEKTINYIEAILYDGELSKNDEIAIANLDGDFSVNKVRLLEEILPLGFKFQPKEKVQAATGLRIQLAEKADITPGMPFTIFKNNKEELKSQFKKEVSDTISSSLSKNGIIAKADSLGSLEALLVILKQENIPVVKVGIGEISKSDVASAKANEIINEIDAVIVGFNVQTNEEAKSLVQGSKIKIITEEVVYKLIERLVEFRNEKRKEIEKQKLLGLTSLFKLKILHQYVFRNTKPAIFGVKVEAGKLTPESFLMEDKGEKIGRVKNIQSENKSVPEATEGMEVAISVPGLNVERQLKDSEFLYSSITSSQLKILQKNKDWLTSKELQILQKVAEIKPAK
jgi:translation initiation factor 5B